MASGKMAGLNPEMIDGNIDFTDVNSQVSKEVSQSRLILMPQMNAGEEIVP
jgi:hypothetical protein